MEKQDRSRLRLLKKNKPV